MFNPYLLQGFGVLEEREGDLPRAMELYKEATARDPSHTASWIAGGRLEKRLRRVQAARDRYQRAVEAEPDLYYACTAGQCWRRTYATSMMRASSSSERSTRTHETRRRTRRGEPWRPDRCVRPLAFSPLWMFTHRLLLKYFTLDASPGTPPLADS